MATQVAARVNKVTKHGIEVPSILTYKSWEPGGEYTKPLVLKNVNLTSKKIRYKMPQSQIFSTTFPQPIVLGSGTSHTLPVTFKPLEKRVVSDSIEIVTGEGSFFIPIRAIIPTANLSLPSSLQFGMCSVLHNITVDFNVSNISDVPTDFQWEVTPPFRVNPVCGVLKSRGTCKLQGSFHPENISVFEGVATCLYGDNQEFKKSIKLEGIGKYPHLVASVGGKSPGTTEVSLSVGEVPIGQTAVRLIHVTNISPVSTSFDITSLTSSVAFTCSECSGVISPEGVYKLKVIFQPQSVESCCEQFIIKPRGGISDITIRCSGRGQGTDVEIVQSCINFGNIACGTSTAHMLHIKNNSRTVKAVYQFQMLPSEGIFSSEASSGVIAPSSTLSLLLHFTPTRPIAYHKKLVCIVHLLPHPLYIDLIGTAYTETTKPAVIQNKHLSLYAARVETGLSRYAPEQLQQLIAVGKLKKSVNDSSLIITESFDGELERPSLMDDSYTGYLAGSHDPTSHHVSVDTTQLQFDNQLNDRQTVNISNHTFGKLYCIWTSGTNVFSVIPEERELLAGACCSFTITFTPTHPGKFYSTVLDCYVCYKSMRDQQDDDCIITTPWCVSVQARGHSFIPASETYLPRALFDPANIIMPSAPLGQRVYQTVVMTNNGNSPIAYDFQLDHGDFAITPSSGLLQDNHQVFIVTMKSSQLSTYEHAVKVKLNGSDKYTEDLTLCGMIEYPDVKLQFNGDFYFMPTCVQCSKTSQLEVMNLTNLHLDYHWRLLEDSSNVLAVSPSSGSLLPNEIQHHSWSFTPRDVIMYKLQAVLVTNSNMDPSQKTKSLLNITGQGELGHLKCDPASLQLDTLVVGTTTHCDVMIQNIASCELTFHLSTSLHVLHVDCSHSNIDNPAGVELRVCDDTIPAGGKKNIRMKIRPCVRGQHTITLKYQLVIPITDQSTVMEQSLCSVMFNAVYPTLTVTSVLGDGSLGNLSKSRLWSMLYIDKLNKLLQGDPSSSELRYALKTRYSTRRKAAVHTNAVSEITFGASPLNRTDSIIHLEVENKGQTPTQWAFQFPEDVYLEPAYWANTGQLDEVEKDEMNIMDSKVFSVHPRTGYLHPSEITRITFSFKHEQCGNSRLPVLLKIGRGREILLFFHGVTVPSGRPYVFFTEYHHQFTPVPIGSHAFPRQIYKLYNGGDQSVNYFIDTQPLQQLQEENYQMSVLQCLHPSGVVPARGSTDIQFVFAPNEVKSYIVELAINFEQHKTVLISFAGEGYDPSQVDIDQPDSSLLSNDSNDNAMLTSSTSSHLLTSGQAIKMSHEMISFGHFPLFATVNRIIFLRNSSTHTVSYQWVIADDDINEVLTFTPSSGHLQPLEAVMCKVTFLSQSFPQIYHLTIPCKITDQTAVAQYKQQLVLWEEQEEERRHLFTITEQDVIQERRMKSIPSSHSDLNKYQALPPIGHTSSVNYNHQNKPDPNTHPKAHKLLSQPEAPVSSYLQLTVNARTYSISDYSQQFDDFNSFFIDKQSITVGISQSPLESASVSVDVVEKDIITSVGAMMLKDLLSDGNLISAIKKISEEPLPYFVQYTQRDRNTGGQAHARHSYAAALEQLSRGGYQQQQPVLQDEQVQQQDDQVISDGYSISQKSGDNTTTRSDDIYTNSSVSLKTTHLHEQFITLEDSIKHLPDFSGLVDEVLNGTILNIVQETISGEANITKLLPVIATPRCNN